jgi:hypothetical protein
MHGKLARLARLRAIEERAAKLELARRLATQHDADQASQAAARALNTEARSAAPADFARWLPRALAERQRARTRAGAAAEAADAARGLMVEAVQSRQVVDEAIAARQAEEAAQAARRAQAALDDQAASRAVRRSDAASTSANRSRSASSL